MYFFFLSMNILNFMFIKIKFKIHIFYTYQLKYINQCISLNNNFFFKKKFIVLAETPIHAGIDWYNPLFFLKNILKEDQYCSMASTTGTDMILTSLVLPPHSNQTPPPTQIQFGYSYLSQMSYIAVNSLKIKRSSTGYQEKEKECIFNFNHKTSHRFHTSHNITTMAIKYILSLLLRLSCWFSFWIMVCMYD